MRYHCIINAYSDDAIRQMEEFHAFQDAFLKDAEQGEAYILCRGNEDIELLARRIAENAVTVTGPDYSPEAVLEVLEQEADSEDLYIFGSGYSGIELSVRLSERLGGSSVTSVHALELKGSVTARKMVYANHMEGAFAMKKGPYCISLAKGMERKEAQEGMFHIERELRCRKGNDFVVSRETMKEETAGGLSDAKIVVAAGRGIRNKENASFLEETAKALGGELGASRPVAMNAWTPMSRLIGVSGEMIAPEVCITAGVSGAAAFYAGIEKSKFIVAINTDEQAPIVKKADVAIVDDFMPVIQSLREIVKEQKDTLE